MSKKSRKTRLGIVSATGASHTNQNGGTTMTTADTINNNTTKIGVNVPSFIADTATENALLNEFTLSMRGKDVAIREYDGYVGFSTSVTYNKVNFTNFPQWNGFLSAMMVLLDNERGTFERGIHCAGGLVGLKDIWQSKTETAELYIQWGFVSEETRSILSSLGITQAADDQANYWTGYSVNRGRIYRKFINEPKTWDVFTAWLKGEKGLEPRDTEAQMFKDWNEKAWNVQNKHDGLEVALRMLEGSLMVGVKLYQIEKAEKLAEKYAMLFAPAEERKAYNEGKAASYKAQRNASGTAYVLSKPEAKVDERIAEVTDGVKVAVWHNNAQDLVKRSELVGKRVKFVHPDNTPARPGTVFVSNDSLVTAIIQMSVNSGGYIAFA